MRWLSIDPGDTTGFAVWDDTKLLGGGQMANWEFVKAVWQGVFDPRSETDKQPTEEDALYFAGLLDGEAWIGWPIVRGKPAVQLVIAMVEPAPALHWAKARYGGSLASVSAKQKGHQDQVRWTLRAQTDLMFALREALPHLKVKHEEADEALRRLGATKHDARTGRIGRIVCEDFVLYPWELRKGTLDFDSVETARVIGALFALAQLRNIDFILQGADIKDAAIAGGAEDLFTHPLHENRHENDAIMHGQYLVQTQLLTPATSTVKDGRLVPRGDG